MSFAIKKIQILKQRSRRILSAVGSVDPLSVLERDYVSRSGLTRSDIEDKIKKLDECANVIELRESQAGNECGYERTMKIAAANFCKQHAVCPICADRMQSRRRARYDSAIRRQASLVSSGSRYAYMLTYTVTDGPDLADRIEMLKRGKRAFRRMGQSRRGGGRSWSAGEAGAIRAGISTIEIKRGRGSGLWHVHSHDLVFTDRPIDYRVYNQEKLKRLREKYGKRNVPEGELIKIANNFVVFNGKTVPVSKISNEWFRSTGGESIGISVDPIRQVPKNCSGKKRRMYRNLSFVDSVAYQAKEVLKYPYKPSENGVSDFVEILCDTYNRRMVDAYGEFRGIPGDDYNDGRPSGDIENYVMIWRGGKYSGAIPGGVREEDEEGEELSATRARSGALLGEYRRHRRHLRDVVTDGSGLSRLLDDAKCLFRRKYNDLWRAYRNTRDRSDRYRGCSPAARLAAIGGFYDPSITTGDVYVAAFS